MSEIGPDRGRHDDRDRGADAKLHAHRVGHAEHAEHLVEHRHDDGAAADAEQAGENPVMTPPTMMASASQSSSLNGTPKIILVPLSRTCRLELRGDVRQFAAAVSQALVRNKRERCGEEFGAGLRGAAAPARCRR